MSSRRKCLSTLGSCVTSWIISAVHWSWPRGYGQRGLCTTWHFQKAGYLVFHPPSRRCGNGILNWLRCTRRKSSSYWSPYTRARILVSTQTKGRAKSHRGFRRASSLRRPRSVQSWSSQQGYVLCKNVSINQFSSPHMVLTFVSVAGIYVFVGQ